MTEMSEAKILIIATDGFEQSELMEPRRKLKEAGATVHVATPSGDKIRGWDQDHWGESVDADLKLDAAAVDDYHAIVIPGGQINPDILRTKEKAVSLVRDFAAKGKIVAAICHGPWLLVEADLARGRDMTSYHSIKTDVKNAGANWVDREVVVSNGIVTSRNPGDIDAFVGKIVEEVREGKHERRVA